MSTDKKTTALEPIVVDRQSILDFPMPPELEPLGLDEFRRKLDEAFATLRQTADLPDLDPGGIRGEARATKPAGEGTDAEFGGPFKIESMLDRSKNLRS